MGYSSTEDGNTKGLGLLKNKVIKFENNKLLSLIYLTLDLIQLKFQI